MCPDHSRPIKRSPQTGPERAAAMLLSYAYFNYGGYIVRLIRRSPHCLHLEIVTSRLPVPAMDPAKRPNDTPPTSDLLESLVQGPLPLRASPQRR